MDVNQSRTMLIKLEGNNSAQMQGHEKKIIPFFPFISTF